ncbi:phospholipid scramblase 2-like isoform X3 [Gigantopelta aegis]|uniref:phospholipid scramblase 2-like isoform X3 n=1 Tax=Gigantopelta aegis TaxID=1735272 RepID=UPI001B88833A|nr:phospholipid scramblase 2-like isoform X3 [Gigantopelta aegis]
MSQPVTSQPQGQGTPGYGTNPQAGYGALPGQYGAPPGQYGAPTGQYGALPGQYGAPPGQYGAPPGQYGSPPGYQHQNQQYTQGQPQKSGECTRQCCGSDCGFIMHITDNMGQEVIRVQREFKCCAGCCWCADVDCCAYFLTVESPVENPIGYVRQMKSCWKAQYAILDVYMNMVLQIKGPCCICDGPCCTWDQEFNVFSRDESTKVGKISKQWPGLFKEIFTDADNFGVTFPVNLDVKMKANLLAAVFLIDFVFFEMSQSLLQ